MYIPNWVYRYPFQPRPFPVALVGSTQVTFDDDPDGTAVDNHYAGKGVTFASITTSPQARWSAYARQSPGAESGPNVVSVVAAPTLPMFDARQGGIEATFSSPQLSVSIDAQLVLPPEFLTEPTNKPFLEAFDGGGAFLGIVYYGPNFGDSQYGTWQTLLYSSTQANIAKVVFSSQHHSGPAVYALFDRLVFTHRIRPIVLGRTG